MELTNFRQYSPTIAKLAEAKPEVKGLDYRESIAWKYLNNFNWKYDFANPDEYESALTEWSKFWSATKRFWKHHTPAQFEEILQWGVDHKVTADTMSNTLLHK